MNEPIFQKILAEDWQHLGKVIREHYFLTPFSDNYICVSGEMSEIYHSNIAKLLIPFGMLFGAIVPYQGKNIPIDVHYNTSKENSNIYWDRVFKFSQKNYFHFKSYMVQVKDNEVIEFVRFGVGMRLKVTVENQAIVFRSHGYLWRILGCNIPLPLNWFFGNAYIEERPIDKNTFSMRMVLEHPLFGVMFRYEGQFKLT